MPMVELLGQSYFLRAGGLWTPRACTIGRHPTLLGGVRLGPVSLGAACRLSYLASLSAAASRLDRHPGPSCPALL